MFSHFPIESATEKENVWKSIKNQGKGCLGKHVNKLAHSSEHAKGILDPKDLKLQTQTPTTELSLVEIPVDWRH